MSDNLDAGLLLTLMCFEQERTQPTLEDLCRVLRHAQKWFPCTPRETSSTAVQMQLEQRSTPRPGKPQLFVWSSGQPVQCKLSYTFPVSDIPPWFSNVVRPECSRDDSCVVGTDHLCLFLSSLASHCSIMRFEPTLKIVGLRCIFVSTAAGYAPATVRRVMPRT